MLVLYEYLALNIIYNLHLIKLPDIFLSRTSLTNCSKISIYAYMAYPIILNFILLFAI